MGCRCYLGLFGKEYGLILTSLVGYIHAFPWGSLSGMFAVVAIGSISMGDAWPILQHSSCARESYCYVLLVVLFTAIMVSCCNWFWAVWLRTVSWYSVRSLCKGRWCRDRHEILLESFCGWKLIGSGGWSIIARTSCGVTLGWVLCIVWLSGKKCSKPGGSDRAFTCAP